MAEVAPSPRRDMLSAWRAAAVAYRAARKGGKSHHLAQDAAEAALHGLHPTLSKKEASDEAVRAIAYATSFYPKWFWDGIGDTE
jgi:hypothetical protein